MVSVIKVIREQKDLEHFGVNPTDSSVGGYWDCYLVTVILVVWFVYLEIILHSGVENAFHAHQFNSLYSMCNPYISFHELIHYYHKNLDSPI